MKDINTDLSGMTRAEAFAYWDIARIELRKLFVVNQKRKKKKFEREWDKACFALRNGKKRTPIEQPEPYSIEKGEKAS